MLEFLIIGFLAAYVIYQRFLHPLAKYPGPFLASFSSLWKAYHVVYGDLEYAILDLHRKYGRIVRIGPNHLDFSDEAAVKDIYLTGKSFVKSSFYNAFTALRPNIFGTRDEDVHSARKKALTPGFSLQSVNQMEPFIDACLEKLIARLDLAATEEETIDLKAWISFFVIDVLGELAFSRSFNMLEKGQKEALPPLREHVFLAMLTGQFPSIIPYVNKYLPRIPIPALQRIIKGRQKLRQLAISAVSARLASPDPNRRDLLAKLISEHSRGALDVVDIQTEAFGFIIAGSHTTATTATLLFWHLLRRPSALARLRAEVCGLADDERRPACVGFAATARCRYLAAAVAETLRVSPVFTMPLVRVVPAGGAAVCGAWVPGGTDVGVTNHALHHDPGVFGFGGAVDRFVPERWLLGGEEAREKAKVLMAFGAGHRACIGRNLASVEINKVAVSLLARYEFELVEGGGGSMPPMTSFGISDLDGELLVRLKRRDVQSM